VTGTQESLINTALPEKLSRRKSTQKRRTEHENAYKSVENTWSPFYGRSPEIVAESDDQIRCRSSVVEHVIGNDEVEGSIPSGSTTQRGEIAEAMVAAKLLRLGASVFTPAFGHDQRLP
jgi:hypothetical protein